MLVRFLDREHDTSLALAASHDPLLVVCSIVAVAIAAYAALGIIRQIKADNSIMVNLALLLCGAVTLGFGIWCMHFIAMLAYHLPIDVHYSVGITVISVIPAIIAVAIALYLVSWPSLRSKNIALGGLLIGAGIGAMHYVGMAAMHLAADMRYSLPLVLLSVMVAVALAMLSLYTLYAFAQRENSRAAQAWVRPSAALIMGIAISGMHYTAMQAVYYFPLPDAAQLVSDSMLESSMYLASPQLATAVLLSLGLVVSMLLIALREIGAASQSLLLVGMQQQNTILETTVHDRTRELQEINEQLERRVNERTAAFEDANRALATLNQQGKLLAEVSEMLQTVRDLEEAMIIMPHYLSRIFSQCQGVLYINKASRSHLERRTHWGERNFPEMMEIADCWGLRRGRPYLMEGAALLYPHTGVIAADEATLCVPLLARSDTIGLLHLCARAGGDPYLWRAWQETAQRVAAQLAVGLANLNLRTELREQSIRDPLTGLHNRRFLEESLKRELSRAERDQHSFAVFMLDVDHFKRYNDQHGHEAGDAVLRALGGVLKESVRSGDLACRFGGEEFTIVLSPSGSHQAQEWAHRLLENVRKLQVKSGNQVLPAITVSLGLALYPTHGTDYASLLQTADLALYAAKHAGRDQLVVADVSHPNAHPEQP